MLKQFAEFLQEQTITPEERIIERDGRKYLVDAAGQGKELKEQFGRATQPIEIHTLSGIVNYVKSNVELSGKQFYINVIDEGEVRLLREMDKDGNRDVRLISNAIVPQFSFDRFLDSEELIIQMQSKFVNTEDKGIILKVVGNIREENVRNTGDDGVSQMVTMKTGVTTVADAQVPNPVNLAPFRTFTEVEQPKSDFIFRMKDGPTAAIFESDGGHWRNEAIKNIKNYFDEELKQEIETEIISIIA